MTPPIILSQTTLCAIVRDEERNPAGGIADFLESVLPHVEAAIVVDTGSSDNTYPILKEYADKHDHLVIDQITFKGFAEARNHALRKVMTPHVLVMDADDRIRQRDYAKIKKRMEGKDELFIMFDYVDVFANGMQVPGNTTTPRLFTYSPGLEYRSRKAIWEELYDNEQDCYVKEYPQLEFTHIPIWHFKTTQQAHEKKGSRYYRPASFFFRKLFSQDIPGPASTPFSEELKQPNPYRKRLETLKAPCYSRSWKELFSQDSSIWGAPVRSKRQGET